MMKEKTDVLVIGAGPAGTIAASILKQQGLNIKIVEKQQFPRFVIGESLLPRCMEHLDAAGLLDAVKAQGFQEKFGAKFVRGDEICDFNFSDQFTEGWNWTWQVPRAQFDKTLADEVERKGVPIDYKTGVTDIKFHNDHSITTVEHADGSKKEIEANFIVDASGYGRVIPRMFKLDEPSGFPVRKAFFAHIKDPRRPGGTDGNRITVVVHTKDIWIWIIPFSTGITSVGFVGTPEFFAKFNGTDEKAYRSMLATDATTADRFKDAELVMQPTVIEGYAITTKKLYGDGFVLTGNATEFLDPVFSSGVTFAMESGHTAAKLVARHLKGDGTVDWHNEYTSHMMQGINTFRSYVSGWYDGTLHDIFFARDIQETFKNQICSVLAGYVWDLNNPFVKKHDTALKALAKVIGIQENS
jgi:flavin-dependent dehydrogenase